MMDSARSRHARMNQVSGGRNNLSRLSAEPQIPENKLAREVYYNY